MLTGEILVGDAEEELRKLPAASIHCVVTSPPYWGRRDYNTGQWLGGQPGCKHAAVWGSAWSGVRICRKCGGELADHQLGLERTPQEYVERLVQVFHEVRRVLRPDGTLWLNLGDTHARTQLADGQKPKDLIGLPWRVVFALQNDGWWLRSEIVWFKTNPLPESVLDRPTSSHESVFLLSKSQAYFYDITALSEPASGTEKYHGGYSPNVESTILRGHAGRNGRSAADDSAFYRRMRDVWQIPVGQAQTGAHPARFPTEIPRRAIRAGTSDRGCCPQCGAPWKRVAVDAAEWQPSCTCTGQGTSPATVLDPFVGSGTAVVVALNLGRNGVGIELNPEYASEARRRVLRAQPPLASEVL